MACKRKKSSWSKFEYVFRNVFPQEREGRQKKLHFVLLCSQTDGFWRNSENQRWCMVTGFLSLHLHGETQKSFSAQILQGGPPETSSLQLLSWNPKKSVVVLSFFGSSWQNLLQSKDAFQRSQRYHVSNGLCCHHPWLFSNTLLQRWPDARFGAIMQVSSLLVSHFELLFYFLKGQSHISCPRCKITSDM